MDKIFNYISVSLGIVGGFLAESLGGGDKWLMALIFFVCTDYVTGVIKAVYNKNLSSDIGFKGIIKKVMIFLVIAIGVQLEKLIGGAIPLRDITVCFYLVNEGISLLENIAVFIPLPEKLKEVLLQLRTPKKEVE